MSEIPDGMRVTISDIRDAGNCVWGARKWFEANGIDFPSFLKAGICAKELVAKGDGKAKALVDRMTANGRS